MAPRPDSENGAEDVTWASNAQPSHTYFNTVICDAAGVSTTQQMPHPNVMWVPKSGDVTDRELSSGVA